jgi:hypothetical protein
MPRSPPLLRSARATSRLPTRTATQQLRRRWKQGELLPIALLDPAWRRHHAGQAEPSGQLRGRQPAQQFEQRLGVAPCLGNNPVTYPLIQRADQHRVEQCPRVGVGQPAEPELR